MDHPFAQRLLWELQRRIGPYRKTLLVLPEGENSLPQRIRRLPLEGAVLLSAELTEETLAALREAGFPLVMCSALPLHKDLPSVRVDDLAAAYDGTRHLLDLGHRRIGFITASPRSIDSGFLRITGCRRALEDRGIPPEERLFFSGDSGYDSGYRGAGRLLEEEPSLSALFAHSDISALGALAALRDRGLRVPGDLSVLGFDGIPAGEQHRPRLSCVRQPAGEIVEKTLELLAGGAGDPGNRSPLSIILKHVISPGESCRNLNAP
jgi:LacI family transcriptional regulator